MCLLRVLRRDVSENSEEIFRDTTAENFPKQKKNKIDF